jgi:hypothetical protein
VPTTPRNCPLTIEATAKPLEMTAAMILRRA